MQHLIYSALLLQHIGNLFIQAHIVILKLFYAIFVFLHSFFEIA